MKRPTVITYISRGVDDPEEGTEFSCLSNGGTTDADTLCGEAIGDTDMHCEVIYEGPGRVTCPRCLAVIRHVFAEYGVTRRKP